MNSHSVIPDGRTAGWPGAFEAGGVPSGPDDAGERRGTDRVAREHGAEVREAEVARQQLGEQVAEVGGEREVAALVEAIGREPGPAAVDSAAAHGATHHQRD